MSFATASAWAKPLEDSSSLDDALARVRADERRRSEVIARAAKSVVCVFDEKRSGGGSGVIISEDGYGLTNFHVVAGMLGTRRGKGGLNDGKLYPIEILGIDPTGDVAMFRISGAERFEPAPLGDSDDVRVGDPVFAMGNPFALAQDYTATATYGIVSGVHRYQYGARQRQLVYTDCIQIDASINPGNSGGPLFDRFGQVIGINGRASFERRGRVNVGLAYAISINQIKRFMPGMKAGLLVEHGTLGATVIDLGYRQVVFDEMLKDSPAARAGIQVGDRLIAFAGNRIESANHFANLLGAYPAGWPVEVIFEHEGRQLVEVIELDPLPVDLEGPFERDVSVTREAGRRKMSEAAPARSAMREVDLTRLAIDQANRSTVKLYGASVGRQPGYAAGVLISPDGLVVTVNSILLEGTTLRGVTHNGHEYPAEVLYRDTYRQLALIQLARFPTNPDTTASVSSQMQPAEHEPFTLGESRDLHSGDWVYTVSNPFRVAGGEERLTVMRGIVSGRTKLAAVRQEQDFPFRGEVLLLDATTSNPGSPGGAVVDLEGRLVGLIGRIVESRQTNTYLSYAYPVEEIRAFLEDARSGATAASRPASQDAGPGYHGIRLSKLGYRRRLPFVASVAIGSPAREAGVRPDDLIVSANGVAIPRVRAFDELCERLHAGDTLNLIVKRGEELVNVRFELTEMPE